MTSHAQRLRVSNNIVPTSNYSPSIATGGPPSSLGSVNSAARLPSTTKNHHSIPEDSEANFSYEKETLFVQKPAIKYSSGPCSSIISGKTPSLAPSIGSRLSITSEGRIKRLSQSLGGSKSSLATEKSHKSTIQQEFHDIKVNNRLNALSYGRARRPFLYSVICFVIGFVFFFIGLVVILLRLYGQLFLSMDKGEIIGPIFMVGAVVLVSIGIKFVVDAYKIGAAERRRLGFRACGRNMVIVKEASKHIDHTKPRDVLQSGTSTNQAVRKVLHPEGFGISQMGSSIR